jgi:methyl-accepting chemotaxis protein
MLLSLFWAYHDCRGANKLMECLNVSSQGDLSVRVLRLEGKGQMTQAARQLNRLLDLMEAFLTEANGLVLAVSANRYHRNIVTTGMPGDFFYYANEVNKTLKSLMANYQLVSSLSKSILENSVDISMSVNNAAIVHAKLTTGMHEISGRVQSTSAATEEMVATTQEIGQRSNDTAHISEEALEAVVSGSGMVNEANGTFGLVATNVRQTPERG